MDGATIKSLLELNRRLYSVKAAEFSATRQKPWRGWERLLPRFAGRARFSVLDAGCGNGRLGVFLRERLGDVFDYTGIDQSEELLADARVQLPGARLIAADLFEQAPPLELHEQFDLVAAMGVLHHVPGLDLRAKFLQHLVRHTREVLALSFWQFDPEKKVAPPPELTLEEGDYLLRFGTHGLRYCHRSTDAERAHLIQSTGLILEDSWSEDDQNIYALLTRTATAPAR